MYPNGPAQPYNYSDYISSVFNGPHPGGQAHMPQVGRGIGDMVDIIKPPDLIGWQGNPVYQNGQPMPTQNDDLFPRLLKSAVTALGYNLISGNEELKAGAVLTQLVAQARKGNDPLSMIQNAIQGGLPLALGLYGGLDVGHAIGDGKARSDTREIGNLLLRRAGQVSADPTEIFPIATEGDMEKLLKATADANVETALNNQQQRWNEAARELANTSFSDQINAPFSTYQEAFDQVHPENQERFKNLVRNVYSSKEKRALEEAERQRDKLNEALISFRKSYSALAMHNVEAMQEKSAKLKGLLVKHSDHVSQETINDSMKALDGAITMIKHAQKPTPRFAKLTNKYFNPKTLERKKDKFNDVRTELESLIENLQSQNVITPEEKESYEALLKSVRDTINSPEAKHWFSPTKLQKRMQELEGHKQTINGIVQQFQRDHAEMGMEQAIEQLGLTDSEKGIASLEKQFSKLVNKLGASQSLGNQLLSKGGALVGFMTLANVIGPALAQFINGLLARVWTHNAPTYGYPGNGRLPSDLDPAIQDQIHHVTPPGAFALNDSLGGEPYNYNPVPYA